MGIISGKEYIDRIDQSNVNLLFDGERVEGKISEHPAFKGIMKTTASLYDMQLEPSYKDKLTFSDPDTKETVGLSYLLPRTKADLRKRRAMMEVWAKKTCGLLGRSPDYMNTAIMCYAASSGILKGKENCFPENMRALYQRAMEKDLSFTHTFITPQVNRSQLNLGFSEEAISARVVERNDKGIIVKGARLLATQGGLTDEVLVYTAPRLFFNPDEAFGFSIPSDTEGVKFICRESFVGGESSFNYPLSSRFEEMDSIVVFDNVFVPWEKVFFYDNVDAATDFKERSPFYHLAYHQVIIRQIAKLEFIHGLAELLVDTININEYQHIQEKCSEIIIGIETMKALLEKSENDAECDEWGVMLPSLIPLQVASNVFPRIYPRFTEIIQLIAASGIVSLPSENAFNTLQADLDLYLQAANRTALDRVKLFRLAWDLTMSSFGTRQTQFERYFFGDPVRLAGQLYVNYPKENNIKTVSSFLNLVE